MSLEILWVSKNSWMAFRSASIRELMTIFWSFPKWQKGIILVPSKDCMRTSANILSCLVLTAFLRLSDLPRPFVYWNACTVELITFVMIIAN